MLLMLMSCFIVANYVNNLQFIVFNKQGQKLKYSGKESTHTPGTLGAITSGALNRLSKLTSRKPSLHSEGVDKICPDHVNALCKAGLAPSNLPTKRDLLSKQDENMDMKKNQTSTKRKTEMSTFVLTTHVIFLLLSTG